MKYKYILILILTIVTFLVVILFINSLEQEKQSENVKYQKTSQKNEYFMVQDNPNEPDWVSKEVANRLSRLSDKIDKLVLDMYNTNFPTINVAQRLYNRWKRIRETPSGLRETSPEDKIAAYTINKGQEMRICVRDKTSEKTFQDENTMMFVMLHELGHLMSVSYGHNTEFKENFSAVTTRALELGVYIYEPFDKENKSYCGTKITNSPVKLY